MKTKLTPQEIFMKAKMGKKLSNAEKQTLAGSYGGYIPNVEKQKMKKGGGLAKSQKSLKDWTNQEWMTSGTHSNKKKGSNKEVKSKGKKRYLPKRAWDNLSSGEKAATNKAKASSNKQFVKQPKSIADKASQYRMEGGPIMKDGGKTKSKVNEAGNYTKPGMRKRLFQSIKAGSKGGNPGQWSARKAQLLAKKYKSKGGGYKQIGGDIIPAEAVMNVNPVFELDFNETAYNAPMYQRGGEVTEDPDGEMVLGQLASINDKTIELQDIITPDRELEPWVNKKITLADAYIDTVTDYLKYDPESTNPMMKAERGLDLPIEPAKSRKSLFVQNKPSQNVDLGLPIQGQFRRKPVFQGNPLRANLNLVDTPNAALTLSNSVNINPRDPMRSKLVNPSIQGRYNIGNTEFNARVNFGQPKPEFNVGLNRRFEKGGSVDRNTLPIIKDEGSMVNNVWVPNWDAMSKQAKAINARAVRTDRGGVIYFDKNWKPTSADDKFAKGGYTVTRSNDRKGKTHKVTGPDGSVKYFGDPKLGERSKSKYGKEAFYKRHAKNLKNNPHFRAYARKTWQDGGEVYNTHEKGLSPFYGLPTPDALTRDEMFDRYYKTLRPEDDYAPDFKALTKSTPLRQNKKTDYDFYYGNPTWWGESGKKFLGYNIDIDHKIKQDARNKKQALARDQETAPTVIGSDGQPYKMTQQRVMDAQWATNRLPSMLNKASNSPFGAIAKGKSGIHIKPENKGKFTASAKAAGRSVQEHARAVLNDPNATPLQKKRANFARNASKWKKQEGGDFNNLVNKYQTQGWESLTPEEQAQYRNQYSTLVRPSGENQFDAMQVMPAAVSTAKRVPYGSNFLPALNRDVAQPVIDRLNDVGETLSTPWSMGKSAYKNYGPAGFLAPVTVYNAAQNYDEILPSWITGKKQVQTSDALGIKDPTTAAVVDVASGFLEPGVAITKAPRLAKTIGNVVKAPMRAVMNPKNFKKSYGIGQVDTPWNPTTISPEVKAGVKAHQDIVAQEIKDATNLKLLEQTRNQAIGEHLDLINDPRYLERAKELDKYNKNYLKEIEDSNVQRKSSLPQDFSTDVPTNYNYSFEDNPLGYDNLSGSRATGKQDAFLKTGMSGIEPELMTTAPSRTRKKIGPMERQVLWSRNQLGQPTESGMPYNIFINRNPEYFSNSPSTEGYYTHRSTPFIDLNPKTGLQDLDDFKNTIKHEVRHSEQYGPTGELNRFAHKEPLKEFIEHGLKGKDDFLDYRMRPQEVDTWFNKDFRQDLIKKGILKDEFDQLSKDDFYEKVIWDDDLYNKYFKADNQEFVKDTDKFINWFNRSLPVVTGAAALGYGTNQQRQKGGYTIDDPQYYIQPNVQPNTGYTWSSSGDSSTVRVTPQAQYKTRKVPHAWEKSYNLEQQGYDADDPMWENVLEGIDPTGILTWDDLQRDIESGQTDPFNAIGVIPAVGKLKNLKYFKPATGINLMKGARKKAFDQLQRKKANMKKNLQRWDYIDMGTDVIDTPNDVYKDNISKMLKKGGKLPCAKCGGYHKMKAMCGGGKLSSSSFDIIDEQDILHPGDSNRLATRENNNPVGFKFTKTITR